LGKHLVVTTAGMGNLLSTKHTSKTSKGPAITDVDQAILSLKAQRKKLGDQQKLLETRIERHAEVARLLVVEKKKDRALLVLKKKKLVEKQHEQLAGLLLNLEEMISNVEMSSQQNKLFNVLKQGNDALKQLQKEVTVEDVQRLMEDTADAKAYQDEVAHALAGSLTDVDEAAVEEELGALEGLVLAQEVEEMPKVPATKVPTPTKVDAGEAVVQAQEEEEEQEEQPARQAVLAS